uniref:Uncharacterized protein n=1 Tax=Knipowitschia caucasica TaxID=637954 RepID=A0AAV2JZE3_KNICA
MLITHADLDTTSHIRVCRLLQSERGISPRCRRAQTHTKGLSLDPLFTSSSSSLRFVCAHARSTPSRQAMNAPPRQLPPFSAILRR